MKKRYSISEQRRCPGCHTKSYSKLLGHFKIYTYHCKKCGYVHSTFNICNSLALVDLTRDPNNLSLITIADVVRLLQVAPHESMSVRDFDSALEKLSRRGSP